MEAYYHIAVRNIVNCNDLINQYIENDCRYAEFNGIILKKYVFEQLRLLTEMNWWIEEFFDYFISIITKKDIIMMLKGIITFRSELNNAMSYYRQNNYLTLTEKTFLKNFYVDMRRISRRMRRRLKRQNFFA